MALLNCLVVLQMLAFYLFHIDSKTLDYNSPAVNGKLPSKCEVYNGQICAAFVGNMSVYIPPASSQLLKNRQLTALLSVIPQYISRQCKPYALKALCLSKFPPCDLTVNYPKKRMFCHDECLLLEQYICLNEFTLGISKYMILPIPPCSTLPKVGSDEYKKCVRMNVSIDPLVFRLQLKNQNVKVGETVVLRCKLKLTEIPPTITWFKNGHVIQAGHEHYKIHLFRHSSRLKIRRIRIKDAGKYTCQASNYISNISSHSRIVVSPSTSSSVFPGSKKGSCRNLRPSRICGSFLQNDKVYFENSQTQADSENFIKKELLRHQNVTKDCYDLLNAALCYEMFPACGKRNTKRNRICRDDCLLLKKTCKNQFLKHCSRFPKRSRRRGKHCERLSKVAEKPQIKCGSYRGNGICKKYVQNETIYFTNKELQQQLEKTIELSLGMISEECLRFGVPAICYHLFPVCFHGEKKSRLCQDECHKIQTDFCKSEMSKMLKFISEELLFPDCSSLPKSNTSFGDHCVQLGIQKKIVNQTKKSNVKTQYDSNHKCYNKSGEDYLGLANVTVFGKSCIAWNITRPNLHWHHNYCRNPDPSALSPWCYVNTQRMEYCDVPKCESHISSLQKSDGDATSLGRTIYVVIAIAAVILLSFITVMVYWKVQNSKESVDVSPANSATPLAKCSSSQSYDLKENASIQSFVLNEKLNRGRVKYVSVMSEGKFFKVFKGVLINENHQGNINIVIKILCEDASTHEKEEFHKETCLLCPLQHVNILSLLGISPAHGTKFVVFEYLSETNLHQYLKRALSNASIPSTETFLHIARQVASGLKYLSEFSYVHGDIAARNCFISDAEEHSVVKISMLAIGSHKYPSDYDWLEQESKLFPIRWMSPEALKTLVLNSENDVWSFAVLLWEIFSCGLKPYYQFSNHEVINKIRAHELLRCHEKWPKFVRDLLNSCWSIEPSQRPNFADIYEALKFEEPKQATMDIIEEVEV